MKRVIFGLMSLFLAGSAFAQVAVQGYMRKDGTYVQPSHRTAPDQDQTNNYSTQGNVNPYTGQQGTVDPYRQAQPTYQQPSFPPQQQQQSCTKGPYGQVTCN